MTHGGWFGGLTPSRSEVPQIDTSVAHSARVYDYWLGGKNHFAADREAAEQAAMAYPEIRRGVRLQRAFLASAVTYLAVRAGIRQFLDIGTGLPSADNTHEVAQRAAPQSRIVYVDNDPIVLAHARALLTGAPDGATAYLDADLRDTDTILAGAARTLDFGQPVAIMLVGILQLIPEEDKPYQIASQLLEAVPSGSWLAVVHPTRDIQSDQLAEAARRLNRLMTQKSTLRSRAEVAGFFAGLELMEPGIVPLNRWPSPDGAPDPGGDPSGLGGSTDVAAYCGLGRKP